SSPPSLSARHYCATAHFPLSPVSRGEGRGEGLCGKDEGRRQKDKSSTRVLCLHPSAFSPRAPHPDPLPWVQGREGRSGGPLEKCRAVSPRVQGRGGRGGTALSMGRGLVVCRVN